MSTLAPPSVRVVSRGELRTILQDHIDKPSRLRYYPLPKEIGGAFFRALDETHQGWYEPVPESAVMDPPTVGGDRSKATGYYTRLRLTPGTYDAWVVET